MFESTPVKQHRILDFDLENRPLAYWFDDRTTAEITAIAWSWIGGANGNMTVRVLEPPPDHETSMVRMLTDFKRAYDQADVVTGHYIIMHDLPMLNSHMIEFGLPALGPKMVSDTKIHLVRHGNMSASQLALSAMLDVKAEKPRMTNLRWRDANRLTVDGRLAAINRVTGDVRQNMELRRGLLKAGLLKPPTLWRP